MNRRFGCRKRLIYSIAAQGLPDQGAGAQRKTHHRHKGQRIYRQNNIGDCQLKFANAPHHKDKKRKCENIHAKLYSAGYAISHEAAAKTWFKSTMRYNFENAIIFAGKNH